MVTLRALSTKVARVANRKSTANTNTAAHKPEMGGDRHRPILVVVVVLNLQSVQFYESVWV